MVCVFPEGRPSWWCERHQRFHAAREAQRLHAHEQSDDRARA